MKCFLLLLACTLLITASVQAQPEAASLPRLTNSEILEMVSAGISSDVIIAKIKVSRCNFDTEPTVLADLRHKGVPNDVLKAMIEAPYGPPKTESKPDDPTGTKPKIEQPLKAEISGDDRLIAGRTALKALRKLKSAAEVGVSYVNYGPLVVDAKTEVEDAALKMSDDALKRAILKAMREYEFASEVWNAYWKSDFVEGEYKNVAVNRYGVKKKGLLRVVWRSIF